MALREFDSVKVGDLLPEKVIPLTRQDLVNYAGVSGDLNPIHVHPLSARLFGFPSAIAHGMWTKARCLAALGSELPPAYTVEVAFRKPIRLPATVQFAEADGRGPAAGTIAFGVRDAKRGTPHLDGRVTASA